MSIVSAPYFGVLAAGEPPAPSWTDVVYDSIYLASITDTDGVWTATGPNGWLNLGLRTASFAAANQELRYILFVESLTNGHVQLGITTTNVLSAYSSYTLGLYLSPAGVIIANESGELDPVVGSYTAQVGDYLALYRAPNSSTWIMQHSTDKENWVNVGYTFTATTSAEVWAQCAIFNNGAILSELHNPQLRAY